MGWKSGLKLNHSWTSNLHNGVIANEWKTRGPRVNLEWNVPLSLRVESWSSAGQLATSSWLMPAVLQPMSSRSRDTGRKRWYTDLHLLGRTQGEWYWRQHSNGERPEEANGRKKDQQVWHELRCWAAWLYGFLWSIQNHKRNLWPFKPMLPFLQSQFVMVWRSRVMGKRGCTLSSIMKQQNSAINSQITGFHFYVELAVEIIEFLEDLLRGCPDKLNQCGGEYN